jgi:dipeptidyl aminopeptidase/acylaminoacyl peptidase
MRYFAYRLRFVAVVFLLGCATGVLGEEPKKPLQPMDVFRIQYADDPQIALHPEARAGVGADRRRIVYVRHFFDVMKDRHRSNLWILNTDGHGHEALTTGNQSDSTPRWSPDGNRLLFLSDMGGSVQLYVRWLDSGRTAKLTDLTSPPLFPAWSPDGRHIAYAAFVAEPVKPYADMPAKPEGAEWAAPFKTTNKLTYRHDGGGYVKDGHWHIFVISSEGGAARQLTEGPFDHPDGDSLSWTADGKAILFAANRRTEGEYDPLDTEIFEVSVADRTIKALTDRRGPDTHPVASPDGKWIAYLGFDDRQQGHQNTRLSLMDRAGRNVRVLTDKLDRSVSSPIWDDDSTGLFFLYDDMGQTRIGRVSIDGQLTSPLATDVGGTSISRPYASGSFSVHKGRIVFTLTRPTHPADIAVNVDGKTQRLTHLNEELFADRSVSDAEEIRWKSSQDGKDIQGWLLKPPGFDPKKKYPLILEIHGGPFANYGERFALEPQLYAAAGYVVLYANPRGSTGYGEEFGNLIHHAYPGHDYDDLMSGVDAVVKKGYIDEKNQFVTGGSGGGVLTCWIVGKTKRFRAAAATYPVINWESWVLTTDMTSFGVRNWFPGPPWEHAEHYRQRSPLSLVGNVVTPTLLMTGEEDYRTPISDTEQYYKALKLRKIDTMLVRVPGASHNVSARPSHLIAKTATILKWFETHKEKE